MMNTHGAVENFFDSVIVNKFIDDEEMCINIDKSKYWQRVKTYSILRWTAKPNCLSPIVCARHGWENIKPNLLRCVSCKKILSATLPDAWEDYYDKALKKLGEMLIKHHEDYCSWKSNPTPNYIYGLPHTLDNDSSTMKYFEDAIDSLIIMQHLPKLNIIFLNQIGASITELKYVYARLYEGIAITHVGRIVFGVRELTLCALAICGWTKLDKYDDILECKYCQRHAGLWNYATIENEKRSFKRIESHTNGTNSKTNGNCESYNNGAAVKRKASSETENGAGPVAVSCGKKLKIAHVAPMPNGNSSNKSNVTDAAVKSNSTNDQPLTGGGGDEASPSTNVNECLKVLPPDTFDIDATEQNSLERYKIHDSNDSHSSEDLPLITFSKSPTKKIEDKVYDLDETDDKICTDILENLVDKISGQKINFNSINQIPDDKKDETHEQNGKVEDEVQPHKVEHESFSNFEDPSLSPKSCSGESVQINEENIMPQKDNSDENKSQEVDNFGINAGKRNRLVSYESSEELNAMLKEDESVQNFDPLSQHRSWCPWVCKQEENSSYLKSRNFIGAQAFYHNLRYLAHKNTQ